MRAGEPAIKHLYQHAGHQIHAQVFKLDCAICTRQQRTVRFPIQGEINQAAGDPVITADNVRTGIDPDGRLVTSLPIRHLEDEGDRRGVAGEIEDRT